MADARRLTAPIAVACVAFTSLVVRAVASGSHAAPRYFPDEYLYTALARSLGDHGRPLVRGTPGDFPALLEPLLAAPLQALFSPEAAYRLAQIENALFMSVAAVPAYLLARRLSLAPWYAAGCAVFAVAIPDLLYSAYILADAVAYPLVLSAILAGVATVDRPSPRSQLAFLALALVTAFARVQYVVLPAAFVVAALAVDRRRAVRAQRLPLILLALALLAILGVGVGRLFGFYSGVTDLWDGTRVAKWIATDLFLVAMSVGVVLVPGAVIALVKARGRTETAFAAFAGTLVLALLTQAALFPRFQERYLFPVLPLIPIAFGLYLKNGRAAPRAAVLIAVVLFAASARLPLSGYTAASGKTDSPFLFAVARLEDAIGVANASLLVAAAAAVGAAAAVAVARWGGGRVALAMTIAFVATASAGAAAKDRSFSRLARRDLAPDRSWVDATRLGDVTLVQTVGSPASPALQQLFFNRSKIGRAYV